MSVSIVSCPVVVSAASALKTFAALITSEPSKRFSALAAVPCNLTVDRFVFSVIPVPMSPPAPAMEPKPEIGVLGVKRSLSEM